ncbi:MAG: insulinase family protein, partial [Planctomycetes bacterium]|nr:insulinase family protein [Planctomycetota bacterium]
PPQVVAQTLPEAAGEAILDHWTRWFGPTNATVFVVGNVNTEAVLDRCRRALGAVEWRDTPRRADFDPPADQAVSIITAKTSDAAQPLATLAWLTPRMSQSDSLAIDVLMQLLCNPVDGPLAAEFTAEGLAPPVWRHVNARYAGILELAIRARTTQADTPNEIAKPKLEMTLAEKGVRAALTVLEKAASEPPSEVLLNRERALADRTAHDRRAEFSEWA